MNFKRYTLLLGAFFAFFASNAQQSELVIEVKTDKYPNENHWNLYSLDGKLRATKTNMEADAYNRDTIMVGSDTCFYWTIFDSYGDGMAGGANNGAPGYRIYFDGELVAENNNANFKKEASEYGIGSSCAVSEVALLEIVTSDEVDLGELHFEAKVVNMGREVIDNITMKYTVDGIDSEIALIEGLNILPGASKIVPHPEAFQFPESGNATLSMTILQANGAEDNMENNSKEKELTIVNGYQFIPLLEVFTSSTCGVCPPANAKIDKAVEDYTGEDYNGKVSLIKYQVSWPSPGDPYTIVECAKRVSYYGVQGAPSLYINGYTGNTSTISAEVIADKAKGLSAYKIYPTAILCGDTALVNINLKASEISEDEIILHTAILEKTTHNNIGNNGETEFSHVLMDMMPNSYGTVLNSIKAGKNNYFALGTNMAKTYMEESDDLALVIFIQNKNTKEILQSEMIDVIAMDEAPILSYNIIEGQQGVDKNKVIVVSSNEALRNIDDSEITDLRSVITLTNNRDNNTADFSATLSADKKTITITPEVLADTAEYTLEIKGLENNLNQEAVNSTLHFTTSLKVLTKDNKLSTVSIYPNPASSELTIESEEISSLEIYNTLGVKVYKSLANKNIHKVNVSNWGKGLYLIHINNTQTKTLIVE